MIVAEIIDRLRAEAMPPFALVEGAAELAAIGGGAPMAQPAAYVFLGEEASAENDRIGALLQRTDCGISIVIVAGNVSDARGAAAAGDIEALKTAVRSCLLGWQPPSADDVITAAGGQMVRVRDGYVWWEMTLATAYYLEA